MELVGPVAIFLPGGEDLVNALEKGLQRGRLAGHRREKMGHRVQFKGVDLMAQQRGFASHHAAATERINDDPRLAKQGLKGGGDNVVWLARPVLVQLVLWRMRLGSEDREFGYVHCI